MPDYRLFPGQRPSPDSETAADLINKQQIGLNVPAAKLIAGAHVAARDNEDTLRPVYKKLIAAAGAAVDQNAATLQPILDKLASAGWFVDGLGSVQTAESAPGQSLPTSGLTCVQDDGSGTVGPCLPGKCPPGYSWVPDPTLPEGGRCWRDDSPPPPPPSCPPGFHLVWVGNSWTCVRDRQDDCPNPPCCPPNQGDPDLPARVFGGDMFPPPNGPLSCPIGTHLVIGRDADDGKVFSCVPDGNGDDTGTLGCTPDLPPIPPNDPPNDPTGCNPSGICPDAPVEVYGPLDSMRHDIPATVRVFVGAKPPGPIPGRRIAGPISYADAVTHVLSAVPSSARTKFYRLDEGTTAPPPGEKCDCPPPEPPPEPKPPEECRDFLPHNLPEIDWDDKQVCQTIDKYMEVFDKVGHDILNVIDKPLGIADVVLGIMQGFRNTPFLGPLIDLVSGRIDDLLEFFRDVICTIRKVDPFGYGKYKSALLGIWFTKGLVKAFKGGFLGVNLGVELEFSLELEFTQLLQIIEICERYALQIEPPSLPEVRGMWRIGAIDDASAECYVKAHGLQWPITRYAWIADREKLTTGEVVALWRRTSRDKDELFRLLKTNGWYFKDETDLAAELAYEVPTPSDLLRFAKREVFRKDKLGVEEMAEEFKGEEGLRDLFLAGGIGPVSTILTANPELPDGQINAILSVTTDPNTNKRTSHWDIPLAHWLEHYNEISPEQSFNMLHRLRPNRVRNFSTLVPNITVEQMQKLQPGALIEPEEAINGVRVTPKPVTSYEVARLLRQLEYNPIWRDRLEAISYRVLTRVDVRRMYGVGTFGPPLGRKGFVADEAGGWIPEGVAEKEVVERFMDQGYTREDAGLLGYFSAGLWEDGAAGAALKKQRKRICQWLTAGIYDEESAHNHFMGSGLTVDEANEAIAECKADNAIKLVQAATKTIHAVFMRGEWDEDMTRAELTRVGLTDGKVNELLLTWRLEMRAKSRQASGSEMCKWRAEGSIEDEEIRTRLNNQFWKPDDIDRFLNSCDLGILSRKEKELEKRRKAQLQEILKAEKLAEKLRKEEEAKKEKARAKLVATFTDQHIKDEWAAGVLNPAQVYTMLIARGFDPQGASNWMATYFPERGKT